MWRRFASWMPLVFLMTIFSIAAVAQQLSIEKIPLETSTHFRGMSVVDNLTAWMSGSKGTIARTTSGGKSWKLMQIRGHESLDFRSIYAFDSLVAVVANAGSPAYIFRTEDGGRNWKTVYVNSHPEAFIDGVDFWNASEGLFYGDAVRGKMLLIKTADGGKSWIELAEAVRPALMEGEGSFAASGTNIRCLPSGQTLIATGGKFSRIFYSPDQATTWTVFTPPIIQGRTMTGIFSIAAIDLKRVVIVGGDYEVDSLRQDHVFVSTDEMRSWKSPKSGTGGIRECAEFITERVLVATGYPGTDVSYDGGLSWAALSNEKGYSIVRKARRGSLILMAGNQKASILKMRDR